MPNPIQENSVATRAAALAACAASLTSLAAADLGYPDFGSTAGLELVGSARRSGSALQLTPDQSFEAGAAWARTRQNVAAPFVTEFVLQLNGSADGMAFVIQDSAVNVIGGAGGDLGFDGVPRSVAIEFDTYDNDDENDPSENHVSVQTRGTQGNSVDHVFSLGSTPLLVDLNDGAQHTVRIESTPGLLRVFVDDAVPALQVAIDLPATLGLSGTDAWVGFTAATGGLTQQHLVRSWSFDAESSVATGNRPPSAPAVNAPATGLPADPRLLTIDLGGYADLDGDAHLCTDYELWTAQPVERVWRASCASGASLTAAGLGAGAFTGSHAGQTALDPDRAYIARARFRDDSGDPLTDFGQWAEVGFQTGGASGLTPLELSDAQSLPAPRLVFAASGVPVDLPAASVVALETASGAPVATVLARTGPGNTVPEHAPLPAAEALRVRIEGGAAGVTTNALELVLFDEACVRRRVLLPPLDVAAGSSRILWVSSDGATWNGDAGQQIPTFSVRARGPAAGWQAASGYQVDVVAEGLELPVNIAFVPEPTGAPGDPFAYVTELHGQIKVITNDGAVSTYASGLLNFDPLGQFPGQGEQGLGGILVEPVTGDLFLSLLYDANGPHYPRVERLSSADGGLTMATRTTVLDMPGEFQGQAHYVSHMELIGDGTMFVHMGDGFVTNTARDLNSFRGKILRMNLDGTAPPDNPFYTAGVDTARDYVWCLGVRNPFGGRTRESDGQHYFLDNGPSVDRFAKVVRGRDYLWTGSNASMRNFALYDWDPAVGPVNLAFIQPGTFGGSGFPADRMDHAFASSAGNTYATGQQPRGKRIEEFVLDANGGLAAGPTTFVEYVGDGRSTVVGLCAGPGGLFFTDLYPEEGPNPLLSEARVLRVRPVDAQGVECGTLGVAVCNPAIPNSSGQSGILRAVGSDDVADDDLTLQARQLPQDSFGLLVASRDPGLVLNVGGGMGTLCLSGTIGRFNAQLSNSGSAGSIDIPVSPASLAPPLGAASTGETIYFQLWFRDFALTPTSNLTDARAITFR